MPTCYCTLDISHRAGLFVIHSADASSASARNALLEMAATSAACSALDRIPLARGIRRKRPRSSRISLIAAASSRDGR